MKRPLIAAAALALAGCALAQPASAATRYVTDATTLSVRNQPGEFQLGVLYGSSSAGPNVGGAEHIYIQKTTSDGVWGYGRAYGNYGAWNGYRCGWVLMQYVRRESVTGADACPNDSGSLLAPSAIFAAGTYDLGCGTGCVRPAVIVSCTYPYVYGNYDPSTGNFANRYPTPLPAGRGTIGYPGVTSGYSGFGWRYKTRDGRAVLIKDTQSPAGGGQYAVPNWHFVRSECIRQI